MCTLRRKIHKLIEDSDPEGKQRAWEKFVREALGCGGCENYKYKKKVCMVDSHAVLDMADGVGCMNIIPTQLNRKRGRQ